MKDVSFFGGNDQFPFRARLGRDVDFSRNDDPVHAHQS